MLGAVVTLLVAALLAGCGGEDIALPTVTPLAIPEQEVDQLYGAATGPYPVESQYDILLPASDEQRELNLNLYYPATGRDFPLLLFSHGNWSNKDSYDRLVKHWASHGYVVIAPDHLDCCSMAQGIFNSLRYGQLGLIDERLRDLSSVLARAGEIAARVPGYAGKADASRIAMTGHSFGGFSAQQFGGARAFDPDAASFIDTELPRVQAVVAISPPGPMFDTITDGSWQQQSLPTMMTTGTWDSEPTFWPDWRAHLTSFNTSRPGNQYALVVDGADHYLGNLICRLERDTPPQTDALRMVHSATTAFLDYYLKQSQAAGQFLDSNELTRKTLRFATLQVR